MFALNKLYLNEFKNTCKVILLKYGHTKPMKAS